MIARIDSMSKLGSFETELYSHQDLIFALQFLYSRNFTIIMCTNLLLTKMFLKNLEESIYSFLSDRYIWILRISLAVIYIWFGILKPFDSSPAADLVANSLPFLPREPFFVFLGVWEVAIGVLFLIPRFTRIAFWVFLAHMIGTFTPFLTLPGSIFMKFPFALTLEGQYIVKNFALISTAVAILMKSLHHSPTEKLD